MDLRETGKIVKYIISHPLNREKRFRAVARALGWQIGIRLIPGPVTVPYVEASRLLAGKGMTSATGAVYAGLQEFEDMAFLLHFLGPDDLFVDVGANIGSYTVLAAAVCRAGVIALEPVLETFKHLRDNIAINRIDELVEACNIGAGSARATLKFTASLGPENHVAYDQSRQGGDLIEVAVKPLDEILRGRTPTLIKIDVDGFETAVLAGAEDTLQSRPPRALIVEMSPISEQFGYDSDKLHSRLLKLGFAPYRYQPFLRRLEPRKAGQSVGTDNTLYLRQPGSVAEKLRAAPPFEVHGIRL